MEKTSTDPCAICLGEISRGQAAFVAECSHTFHHRCISDSVAHGHRACPLCKAAWRDVPAVDPIPAPPTSAVVPLPPPPTYADDDPVSEIGVDQAAQGAGAAAAGAGAAVLRTHCERPSVARGEPRDGFAVLVHARAPGAAAADAPRAPLDLVTVLDVSGSMEGQKLALLKRAMAFVIDNLGPEDRLSVVSFSDAAHREIRLARMADDGKASARRAVESLHARGCTDIAAGLRVAAEVLAGRRCWNPVTSVILLSDGQDNCGNRVRYVDLLPPSFRGAAGSSPAAPIHAFGFGADHDAAAMHAIAEATRGTFSFVENQEAIQDSFAQCIGGLLSVVMQNASVAVTCVHAGVRVREVKSGRYGNLVADDGRSASVDLGELYADEERRFLVFVDVPRAEATEEATELIKVRCTYRDTATGQAADVTGDDAVVQRPVQVPDGGAEPSMEVELERVRLTVMEDMAAARAAAELGDHAEAAQILERRREAVRRSAPAMAGEPTCAALEEELDDLRARVADQREYRQTGRACVLVGMSSHLQQRASVAAVRRSGGRTKQCARRAYVTEAMKTMVGKSKRSREQQQPPSSHSMVLRSKTSPPPPKRTRGGSDGGASQGEGSG